MPVWLSVVVVILIAAGLVLNLVVGIIVIHYCRKNKKTDIVTFCESENVSVLYATTTVYF